MENPKYLNREKLEGLSALIKSGAVKPVIQKIYSWKELPQAHRVVEAGNVTGKIGITHNGNGK